MRFVCSLDDKAAKSGRSGGDEGASEDLDEGSCREACCNQLPSSNSLFNYAVLSKALRLTSVGTFLI
jgi:hypothetical protein